MSKNVNLCNPTGNAEKRSGSIWLWYSIECGIISFMYVYIYIYMMRVIMIKEWVIKILKTICFYARSLQIHLWTWNIYWWYIRHLNPWLGFQFLRLYMALEFMNIDAQSFMRNEYIYRWPDTDERQLIYILYTWLCRSLSHDDVMTWKHFLRHWPFVRRIHLWPVDSVQKEPVTGSFGAFFDVRLEKLLNKQLSCR